MIENLFVQITYTSLPYRLQFRPTIPDYVFSIITNFKLVPFLKQEKLKVDTLLFDARRQLLAACASSSLWHSHKTSFSYTPSTAPFSRPLCWTDWGTPPCRLLHPPTPPRWKFCPLLAGCFSLASPDSNPAKAVSLFLVWGFGEEEEEAGERGIGEGGWWWWWLEIEALIGVVGSLIEEFFSHLWLIDRSIGV